MIGPSYGLILLAYKEMAIIMNKLLDLDGSSSLRVSSAAFVNGTISTGILMVNNNIIAFFCRVNSFLTVHTEACVSKPL